MVFWSSLVISFIDDGQRRTALSKPRKGLTNGVNRHANAALLYSLMEGWMMRRRCPFQRHGMLTEGQLVGLVGLPAFSPYTRCEGLVGDTRYLPDVFLVSASTFPKAGAELYAVCGYARETFTRP